MSASLGLGCDRARPRRTGSGRSGGSPALRNVRFDPGLLHWMQLLFVRARPSMVRMDRPFASATRMTHERVALPLASTVQVPHCPMPQPNFVPLSRKSSRRNHTSGMSALSSGRRNRFAIRGELRWAWLRSDFEAVRDRHHVRVCRRRRRWHSQGRPRARGEVRRHPSGRNRCSMIVAVDGRQRARASHPAQ